VTERCPECGWVFGDEDQLRTHRHTHHGVDPAADLPPGVEPPAPAGDERRPSRALLIGGYAGAILFSPVGLVIGTILTAQRHVRHGVAILGISLVILGVGIAVQLGDDDGGGDGNSGSSRSQRIEDQVDCLKGDTPVRECLRRAGGN
jgi:hypothetical protein